MGVVSRVRALPRSDRLLLLLIGAFSIAGSVDNYFRLRGLGEFRLPLAIIILWVTLAGTIFYSALRQHRRLRDYGFSFNRGGVGSLAAVVVLQIYSAIAGKLVPSTPEGSLWVLIAVGAFLEEIIFRVVLIDELIILMHGVRGKAFWAILTSSAVFSAVHITSKSPIELQGIFLSSLIMGWVYYKTRSVLFPAWLHAVSNAGFAGGVLAVLLYCVATAADRVTRLRNRQTPLTPVPSTNS
jgi:membrane protease YdiL (CAAX protease family)